MNDGLSAETRTRINAVFLKYPKIEKVILYGSRAKGTQHQGSDIDLTLVGDRFELVDLYAVDEALDLLNLPYTIDLSLYGQIDNEGLVEHIERRGKVFYLANKTWEIKKLGDVCTFVGGGTPSKANEDFYTGIIPWATVRDMNNDTLINTQFKITQEAVKHSSTNIIPKGNIVIATRVGLGKVCFLQQDTAINRDLKAIIPKDENQLSKNYLFWWLKFITPLIIKAGTGATVQGVKLAFVKSLKLPLPPINEQKHIVAILDQAFAEIKKARANAEQNLKNARELFESCLNSRLLDVCSNKPEQTLSCITEIIVDCEHKTAPTQKEGFPSIRTPNIGKGKLLLNGVRRVSEETYKLWTKRAVPQYGDLILAREAPAGNVGVIPKGETVCLGQRTVLIRPKAEAVNPKYLAFLLLHPIMQERLLSHSTGATVQHVNMKDIRKLPISKLPSVNEQINDVSVLEDTQSKAVHLEGIYSRKLQALDELKKSILQKAFTGELTKKKVA